MSVSCTEHTWACVWLTTVLGKVPTLATPPARYPRQREHLHVFEMHWQQRLVLKIAAAAHDVSISWERSMCQQLWWQQAPVQQCWCW
jgi:hypothetical protein